MVEKMKGMNQKGKDWKGRTIFGKSQVTLLLNYGFILKILTGYYLLKAGRCSTHSPITILHEVFV